jgi:hypothetical protein
MDQHPSSPQEPEWPPVPPGHVQARHDEQGSCLVFGAPEHITTEQLRVGYAPGMTWEVHDRLYPLVRELIRQTLDQLRLELRELDPQLTLTSIND